VTLNNDDTCSNQALLGDAHLTGQPRQMTRRGEMVNRRVLAPRVRSHVDQPWSVAPRVRLADLGGQPRCGAGLCRTL